MEMNTEFVFFIIFRSRLQPVVSVRAKPKYNISISRFIYHKIIISSCHSGKHVNLLFVLTLDHSALIQWQNIDSFIGAGIFSMEISKFQFRIISPSNTHNRIS